MILKEHEPKSREDLEELIEKAIKKVDGTKENDLCKYLPGPTGGYMHHFTLRKLKNSDPAHLLSLLQEFIINSDDPRAFDPKPRAPRGSRKQRDFINFSRTDIERVLELARQVGDNELLSRFSPKRSLPSLKRELIRSIRENRINQVLWNAYAETISTIEAVSIDSDN
ncbi:MAG: hypothetical protein JJU12_04325 [Chlamydiales bacterium]|nr:hypothetical protein [Chlamydiales bacterium]